MWWEMHTIVAKVWFWAVLIGMNDGWRSTGVLEMHAASLSNISVKQRTVIFVVVISIKCIVYVAFVTLYPTCLFHSETVSLTASSEPSVR